MTAAPSVVDAFEARVQARAAELRRKAELFQRQAELEISALLTAAQELEALLAPPAAGEAAPAPGPAVARDGSA